MLDYSKAVYPDEFPFLVRNGERVFIDLPTEKMSNFLSFEMFLHKRDLDARGYIYKPETFSVWEEFPDFIVPHKIVGYTIEVVGKKGESNAGKPE